MDNMEHIHEFETVNSACVALDVMNAIKGVAEKYGLAVKLSHNVKFTSQIMTVGYDLIATDTNGKSGRQAEFDKYASLVGLKPEHYGKTIKLNRSFYKISGIRPYAHKNKVCIESARGKGYVCDVYTVLKNLIV